MPAQGGVAAYEPSNAPTTTTAQHIAQKLRDEPRQAEPQSRRSVPAASTVIATPNPTRQATTHTTSPGHGLPLLHATAVRARALPAEASHYELPSGNGACADEAWHGR